MKYYAVRCGKTPGVYTSWEECRSAIEGFSGAEYKSFKTEREAELYAAGRDIYREQIEADLGAGYAVAYTDGSFDKAAGRYSWGNCIFDLDGSELHFSGAGEDPDFIGSNNIPGEVFGVLNALKWAAAHGRKRINICYDYAGLEHWAEGSWKANTKIAAFYKQEFKKYGGIEVVFTKIPGHSGNPYNETADRLAAAALKGGARSEEKAKGAIG
jgi:ribonuclease HI